MQPARRIYYARLHTHALKCTDLILDFANVVNKI